jgi:hypothetical protein
MINSFGSPSKNTPSTMSFIAMTPEEFKHWRTYGCFVDYLHAKKITQRFPRGSLVVVTTPWHQALYLIYLSPDGTTYYERYPELPRPIRQQYTSTDLTLEDIASQYGLPKGFFDQPEFY